jgi:hypothetical protein
VKPSLLDDHLKLLCCNNYFYIQVSDDLLYEAGPSQGIVVYEGTKNVTNKWAVRSFTRGCDNTQTTTPPMTEHVLEKAPVQAYMSIPKVTESTVNIPGSGAVLTCTLGTHALTVTRQRDERVPLTSTAKTATLCSNDAFILLSHS